MAVVKYENLQTPNEVITKMYEFLTVECGYTPIVTLQEDLNIWNGSSADGYKFTVLNKTSDYYIHFRSANGIDIFGYSEMGSMSISSHTNTSPTVSNQKHFGVGMTISDSFDLNRKWFDHFNVPKEPKTNSNQRRVYGCFLQVPSLVTRQTSSIVYNKTARTPSGDVVTPTYTLYCNSIFNPTETVMFSLMKTDNVYYQCSHMVFGITNKFGEWEGGIYMSSSLPAIGMDSSVAVTLYNDLVPGTTNVNNDSTVLPLFGSSLYSNTLLRIDIDEAINDSRGDIHWASSGKTKSSDYGFTGKKLSTPIRTGLGMNGEIPHYRYMQSQSRLNWGRDVSSLNCISVNMPIYFSVMVDPDSKMMYTPVGVITGLYYTNILNMQSGEIYATSYPDNPKTCQVFSMGKRRGIYGYDGIAFRQDDIDDSLLKNFTIV